MLLHLLNMLPTTAWHRVMRVMLIDVEAFHDWLHGFCPCGDLGLEEEIDALEAKMQALESA